MLLRAFASLIVEDIELQSFVIMCFSGLGNRVLLAS